ncbi:MAG: hypothetical protein LRZ88_11615 [Candidatus Cloacimonetes bacterium]|nr:hypothetical protein [Candidatus Cloacimonadota bacterium]
MTGLRLVQTDGIYAIPMEGVRYYYSVAAVNERGQVLPGSAIQSAIPVDNPPALPRLLMPLIFRTKAASTSSGFVPPDHLILRSGKPG